MTEKISGETLYSWRQWAIGLSQLNSIDVDEVDWLLQGLTSLDKLSLRLGSYRDKQDILCQASIDQLTQKWQQRIDNRVPVQYLAGETPWRNFSLTVSSDVLIPRPETELIINLAKRLVEQSPIAGQIRTGHWADLGTGSGAIALGLAHGFPKAIIHAVDISQPALRIAQLNAEKNNLDHRILFSQGSWLSPLSAYKEKLVGIVSNPPYIPTQTVLSLQPEVVNHEPHLALDGGPDGLSSLKILVSGGANYLQNGGLWITELMAGQVETVAALLNRQGSYTHISIHQDLSGINRFVSAYKAL